MIELLILRQLNKKILTMYGIFKEIKQEFSILMNPSYGTLKPALKRLENGNFIKTQKEMSSGGRPSTYYSITDKGIDRLKDLILEEPLVNPIHFLPTARMKLISAEFLNRNEQIELYKILKFKAERIAFDIKNILELNSSNFHSKLVLDNLVCEYKNFISLLEGFERASKN